MVGKGLAIFNPENIMDRYAILTGRQPQQEAPIDKTDEVEVFGFEKRIGAFEKRYRARRGFIDRGAIVATDPNAMFMAVRAHYFKDRYFICKGSRCCEKLGHWRYRVGAILCKYRTDAFGVPQRPFSWELLPWIFGEVKYETLKGRNAEYPLMEHDIKIQCLSEEYQTLDIAPCVESLWTMNKDIKSNILKEFFLMWGPLKENIAEDLSLEQIDEFLG